MAWNTPSGTDVNNPLYVAGSGSSLFITLEEFGANPEFDKCPGGGSGSDGDSGSGSTAAPITEAYAFLAPSGSNFSSSGSGSSIDFSSG